MANDIDELDYEELKSYIEEEEDTFDEDENSKFDDYEDEVEDEGSELEEVSEQELLRVARLLSGVSEPITDTSIQGVLLKLLDMGIAARSKDNQWGRGGRWSEFIRSKR